MAFSANELTKTIVGQKAYASDRSFLQFVTDSLRDIGIVDRYHLPSFKNEEEETTVRHLLQFRDELFELKDLAYTVKAHRSILDRANDGEIEISAGEYKFHQDFITENEFRVKKYEMATETPTEMLNRKIDFLEGMRSRFFPHPWNPNQTPRPSLIPLIDGATSFLQEQKSRIKSERICLDEDISGFSDEYLQDFIQNYSSIPSWSRIDFNEHWARNIPPFSLPPGVDFVNRPSQVTSVFNQNASSETQDAMAETSMLNNRPTRSVSESEQDIFGEDSDADIEILPSPSKKQGLASI